MLTDPDAIQPFAHDWTNRWTGHPLAGRSTVDDGRSQRSDERVRRRQTLLWLRRGNTGLVAGSVAPAGSVLLSTNRLVAIDAIDRALDK